MLGTRAGLNHPLCNATEVAVQNRNPAHDRNAQEWDLKHTYTYRSEREQPSLV